jgi:hypothetical protein
LNHPGKLKVPGELNLFYLQKMENRILKTDFEAALKQFSEISLDEMNRVKLLNRFDSKYILHTNELSVILFEICTDYFVLNVDNTRIQTYNSVYFDTPADDFYLTHHNGKAGRFKVRKREYVNSAICFTEVKYKSNKGKTDKKRIPANLDLYSLNLTEKSFVSQILNFDAADLQVKISTGFNRITFVNKELTERCTIDFNLSFENGFQSLLLSNMAIIELKRSSHNQSSKLAEALKKYKIQPSGFSKYCMGRALIEPLLKRNQFKPGLLKLHREFKIAYCSTQAVSA